MAQSIGEPSRNAAEESFRKTRQFFIVTMVSIAGLALFAGYSVGSLFPIRSLPPALALGIDIVMFVAVGWIGRYGMKRMDEIDRDRMAWRKGALGESSVARTLERLPDSFVVIHDVSKRLGNIDHVVIGPTGVYVIDTKNWKGTVKSDGKGELLLNGKVIKPTVKPLLGSVMDFQNKLKALTEQDHFVRGLLVFPIAYLDAPFGTTRHIHCLREEMLIDYVQNEQFAHRLPLEDVNRIKRATLQLAQMDESFVPTTVSDDRSMHNQLAPGVSSWLSEKVVSLLRRSPRIE